FSADLQALTARLCRAPAPYGQAPKRCQEMQCARQDLAKVPASRRTTFSCCDMTAAEILKLGKERAMAANGKGHKQKIGWIGAGRMGTPMAERLIKAGYDVTVWNRTRAKAEPLAKLGGTVADHLFELKNVDVLFSIVSTGKDVQDVLYGKTG